MPDYSYTQSQQPAQAQGAPVRENIHTAVTITTDRTLQAPSVAQLQDLQQTIRKNDYTFGFGL